MPIVGPNSDLKVSNNIWYYMSDGSGLPVSGAGTDYYQLRPATNVWMQEILIVKMDCCKAVEIYI